MWTGRNGAYFARFIVLEVEGSDNVLAARACGTDPGTKFAEVGNFNVVVFHFSVTFLVQSELSR
jgi:hypothetical protein